MDALPEDFDLAAFTGAQVNLITIGLYQLDISFLPPADPAEPAGYISIEGAWELTREGQAVDASEERTAEGNERRQSYRIHRLLGRAVTGWAPEPPSAFRLDFAGGYSLRIVDDTDGHYEFLHVQRPGAEEVEWHL